MSNNNFSTAIEDEHQIASLLIRWGHARDSDDWEILSGCFHDDATIHISWITGPAQDFIAQTGRPHQAFDFSAVDPDQSRPRIRPVPREPLYPLNHGRPR